MKRYFVASVLICFAVCAVLPSTMQAQTHADSIGTEAVEPVVSVETQVLNAFNEYKKLIKAGNYAESIKFYADDPRFIWVEDGRIKYDSKGQVRRALDGLGGQGVVETAFGAPRIWKLSDTQAHVFVRFRTTIQKGTPKEFTYSGGLTIIMEDMKDGGWQFIAGHTSSGTDLPTF